MIDIEYTELSFNTVFSGFYVQKRAYCESVL